MVINTFLKIFKSNNMKKVFFSLMLMAALVFGFTSCEKKASESDTHSQTFTLGETTYDIDNVITIENIKYEGSDVYNAIVLSQGQMIGNTGGEGRGVTILFKGNITAGTYNLTGNDSNYPKYVFANLTVEDIVNFDIDDILDDEDAYYAIGGSFTLEIDGDTYTITTDGIEVEYAEDPAIVETSSVDYEGSVERYVLADVVEGDLNGVNIVTAGTTKYNIMFIETQIVAFITEEGDMLGVTSTSPFTNGIPTGEFTNSDYPIILIEGMNINAPKFASSGNIVISKEGDYYTVDITNMEFTGLTDTYTMHYVGTMPYFDFPF